jgi:hypothetical protein
MDERAAIERLGPPDEIVGREDRAQPRMGLLDLLRDHVERRANANSGACTRCGGSAFEMVREQSRADGHD